MTYDPYAPQPHSPTGPTAPQQPIPPTGIGRAPGGGSLAVSGFICALAGLVIACIPVISILGVPPLIVGLVLSAVGMSRHHHAHRGLAVAGLVLALVGLPATALVATMAYADPDTSTGGTVAQAPVPVTPAPYVDPSSPGSSGSSGYDDGLSSSDSAFLDALDSLGVPRGSDASTISLGHTVCSYLADGGTPEQSAQVLVDNGYQPYDAGALTGASIGAYCPHAG